MLVRLGSGSAPPLHSHLIVAFVLLSVLHCVHFAQPQRICHGDFVQSVDLFAFDIFPSSVRQDSSTIQVTTYSANACRRTSKFENRPFRLPESVESITLVYRPQYLQVIWDQIQAHTAFDGLNMYVTVSNGSSLHEQRDFAKTACEALSMFLPADVIASCQSKALYAAVAPSKHFIHPVDQFRSLPITLFSHWSFAELPVDVLDSCMDDLQWKHLETTIRIFRDDKSTESTVFEELTTPTAAAPLTTTLQVSPTTELRLFSISTEFQAHFMLETTEVQVESQLKHKIRLNRSPSVVEWQRSLLQTGAHRILNTRISVEWPLDVLADNLVCQLGLVERLSRSIYVDRYEVDEREKFGGPRVILEHVIDLEQPSIVSDDNFVIVISESDRINSRTAKLNASIDLPIHFRYQQPGRTTHLPVAIERPLVFVRCVRPASDKTLMDGWIRLNIPDSELLVAQVPVGQLDHYELVNIGTLVVTVLGAFVVILTTICTQMGSKSKTE